MKSRCNNPKNISYPHYGGRGIQIYPAWRHSFETFLADVGRRPDSKHSLDRIDNDGHYEPGNVRWATRQQQVRNRSIPNAAAVGQQYGRWLVLEEAPPRAGKTRWLCRCVCGAEAVVIGKNLSTGISKSCGCLQRERSSEWWTRWNGGRRPDGTAL
jgi:hypothetical protein